MAVGRAGLESARRARGPRWRPRPRAWRRPGQSRWSVCSSSLSEPSGETDCRSRRISRPPPLGRADDREARVDPAVALADVGKGGPGPPGGLPRARRSRPRRARRARGGPPRAARPARRSSLPPSIWSELHRGDDQRRSPGRAPGLANVARHWRASPAARATARALERVEQRRVGVDRPYLAARAGEVQGDPAGAAARAPAPGRRPVAPARSHSGQVGRVAAALDVVPDDPRSPGSSPSTPCQAALGEQGAKLEQRRVGGKGEQRAIGLGDRAVERAVDRLLDLDRAPAASPRTSGAPPSRRPACPRRPRGGRGRRAARSRRPRSRRRRGRLRSRR